MDSTLETEFMHYLDDKNTGNDRAVSLTPDMKSSGKHSN